MALTDPEVTVMHNIEADVGQQPEEELNSEMSSILPETDQGAQAVRVNVHTLIVQIEETVEAAFEREQFGSVALQHDHTL